MPDVKGKIIEFNDILEEFTKSVPLVGLMAKVLIGIWKKKNPQGTFAEFNAYLASESINLQVVGEADLLSMGWTKVNGDWVKDTTCIPEEAGTAGMNFAMAPPSASAVSPPGRSLSPE